MGLAKGLHRVAELGPGDSFGIGLAAMLSGANEYYAFDAKKHAVPALSLKVFDELVDLFSRREPIPDEVEFPEVAPRIATYKFPASLLSDEVLAVSLKPARLDAIRKSLQGIPTNSGVRIAYVAPWDESSLLEPGVIDMAFSQAVLEHVNHVAATYCALYRWLRPGGLMSHAIDFKCHGITRDWHGHWTVSDFSWKLVRGNRPYLINRFSHSAHIQEMEKAGFRIVTDLRRQGPPLSRDRLARRFRGLSDQDLVTSSAFIQAVKSPASAEMHAADNARN
jgi:hypothetical protein